MLGDGRCCESPGRGTGRGMREDGIIPGHADQ